MDTYRIRAAETNRFLHLSCEEKTSGSEVDLLVTVFEEVNGQLRRLFGKHKPDGATLGADIDLWVYIDSPKDLTITVRDLMDDDASDEIPYHLRATFEDAVEGNHNFSNALPLAVGEAAISDAIDEIDAVATYHFKVCDAQNNEGSSIPYTITADSRPVVGDPGHIAETTGETLFYYSETDTEANETDDVELEIFSNLQPTFKANTAWLDFRDPLAEGITLTDPGDGTTVITFPWVCGYVDYQGDRDFFQIDLGKLDPDGVETSWYFDIQIRLVVPSPGSEVEYVWKLYRDSNRNAIIMDDPTSRDGYKACDGDITPQTTESLDLITPTGDDTFWIGSVWGEDAKFYLGVSDFNFLQLPGSNQPNDEPDNDWGYDAPYYFTITLTYHPDQAHPE